MGREAAQRIFTKLDLKLPQKKRMKMNMGITSLFMIAFTRIRSEWFRQQRRIPSEGWLGPALPFNRHHIRAATPIRGTA
jgi:hypothetical protein